MTEPIELDRPFRNWRLSKLLQERQRLSRHRSLRLGISKKNEQRLNFILHELRLRPEEEMQ